MQVVDPTGVAPEAAVARGTWHLDIRGATIGFLWNGKPNADNLFRAVERRLQEKFGAGPSIWADKSREARGPGLPAPEEIFQRLTSGAIAVLTGSGD